MSSSSEDDSVVVVADPNNNGKKLGFTIDEETGFLAIFTLHSKFPRATGLSYEKRGITKILG